MATILNFLMGWLEGPVVFAQDIGWFILVALGPVVLLRGLLQGYGPNSLLTHPRRQWWISLGLWATLLLVYDRSILVVRKWMMAGAVFCWVVAVVIVLCLLYLVFRDDKKGIDVFP